MRGKTCVCQHPADLRAAVRPAIEAIRRRLVHLLVIVKPVKRTIRIDVRIAAEIAEAETVVHAEQQPSMRRKKLAARQKQRLRIAHPLRLRHHQNRIKRPGDRFFQHLIARCFHNRHIAALQHLRHPGRRADNQSALPRREFLPRYEPLRHVVDKNLFILAQLHTIPTLPFLFSLSYILPCQLLPVKTAAKE